MNKEREYYFYVDTLKMEHDKYWKTINKEILIRL